MPMTPDELVDLLKTCHEQLEQEKYWDATVKDTIACAITRIRETADHELAIEALRLLVRAQDLKGELGVRPFSSPAQGFWDERKNIYTELRDKGWAKAREALAAQPAKIISPKLINRYNTESS